ncbi:serine hydrolase [Phytohabitans rumicis]|uniref:Beta-lactamase class A catalytic domain-containing protein n=1 Tax=Phytohabitans rumicis TaxID=1076125 RepID=A0A6V8L1Z1_9ACTN|nr:serine hydrolase [Phytohabitans rumicis]GFJ90154.1 hypothetical protein Prum_037960 [Phytohabitans rumicis]
MGRKRRSSTRGLWWLLGGTAFLGLVLAGLGLRTLPGSPLAATAAGSLWEATTGPSASAKASPTPSPSPSLEPLLVEPGKVTVKAAGFWNWAMLDQRTGKIYGSSNMASTSTTASLIKAWIGADYLRRAAENGQKPSAARMQQLRIMIRDSDNAAASSLWQVVGGAASVNRLIKICKLTDSKASSNWSNTRLSARDTARMGACIADGRAAGKQWTNYLLNEMQEVRGVGDFGVRKAFPTKVAQTIAIKNGWVTRSATNEWNVNCLAIGDGWTIGVMTRYPANLGYTYGANICKSVGQQLKV